MSRFLKIAIVLLAIAAMATPVMAEDMLSLGGQARVRGWYKDFDTDSTNSYIDQRLRIGGKLSVADGVSITFRTDITEQAWGNGGSEYGSGRMGGTQQWDRAHIDLTKGNVHVRAGQQYVGYGLAQTINSQDAGFKVDFKGAVPVSAFWLLDDQNGTNADSYLYGANAGFKGDNFKANLFGGGQTKSDLLQEENVYMLGADVVFNLEALTLSSELNYFTGDASDDVDAVGLQFFLDAAFAVSETLTVGGEFYYAQGTDDVDERQYTYLGNDFNGYDPLFDLGTSLHDEQIMFGRPFDLVQSIVGAGFGAANNFTTAETDAANSSGALGARVYAKAKVSDSVSLGGSFAYMEPEEDVDGFDSAMFYADSMKYKVMANTSLQAQLQYVDLDADLEQDNAILGGVGLFVNF